MKTYISVVCVFLCTVLTGQAQINLVGASLNTATGSIDIVKWQALDSSTITTYPTNLQGYVMNSSLFDAFNSNYYLSGITPASNGLFSFNTVTNQSNLISYNAFSNSTEIDMSTGKIYSLTSDSTGYINVYEFDINTGTGNLLGVISEPGILGIVSDATGFDSNNGILYYVGYDGVPSSCLYSIPVRNPVFSWSKTTLLTTAPGNNFTSVNYDNVHNIIYASNAEYDSSYNYIGNKVVEINKTTGDVITRGFLAGFPYYLAGSSAFDQNSGSLLLVGFDSSFVQRMIVFDTYNNTYQTGFAPGFVSEIVCDNYAFAQNAYATVSVDETNKPDVTMFPNPATSKFTLKMKSAEDKFTLKIFNVSGRECFSREIENPETEISTEFLTRGVYLVSIQNQKISQTKKLVVQ
ncbi:MAG: T9SS type A sorting domain-containing protein [Bacteroidales bacterium]